MKITVRGPDLLLLEDLGAPIRLMGGILILVGVGFAWSAASTATSQIAPSAIAVVCVLGGLAALVLPQRVTAAFDRTRHTLVITHRSLLRGFKREEVDFSKIASVVAEPGERLHDANQTYRVCIVLQNGTRLPLTSYFSSSSCHAIAAAAASEFLGLARAPSTPAHPAMPSAVLGHPNSKAALVFTFLFSAIFCGVGGSMMWREWHLLSVALPTQAVVLGTNVETHRGSKSTTYKPVVAYRYHVDGANRVSSKVTVLNESRSGRWAYDLVAHWRTGDVTTAWYDPADPDTAFLLHEWSFLPLFFVGFSVLFMFVVLYTAAKDKRLRAAAAQVKAAT